MKLLPANVDIDFLQKRYDGVTFSLYKSSDKAQFISCFVAKFSSAESCESNWSEITSSIALNYQVALTSEFASWNIYLALISPTPLERSVKYRIENDRFALRKIVLRMEDDESSSPETVVGILENAILGADLEIGRVQQEIPMPLSPSIIRAELPFGERIPIDNKDASVEMRKALLANLMHRVLDI